MKSTNYTTLSRTYLLHFLIGLKGKIFTVQFVKSNGENRVLNGRLSVGYKRKTNRPVNKDWKHTKGFLSVFDLQKKAFRTVNLNTVSKVRFNNCTYFITN